MSAREKAVEAMWSRSAHTEPIGMSSLGMLLDAIPAEVLAELAVERGGFDHIGSVRATKGTFVPAPEDLHYGGPVYRIVGSDR